MSDAEKPEVNDRPGETLDVERYLAHMARNGASDLYFATGAPPHMKVEGRTHPISKHKLPSGAVRDLAMRIMTPDQRNRFDRYMEMNLGLAYPFGRFRVNVFLQRGEVSMVVRFIKSHIPPIEDLGLPPILKQLVLAKQGLILVVGATGSGKSTSLASMIDHRNRERGGHTLTVEDPIEYAFDHRKSIVCQREVGLDTLSYENALREAMREAPDVIMIGEVRDRRTMEAAISYADTGHLCLTTLHAVNAYQAMDRIVNMFPPEAQNQVRMDLSLNLNAIISQRLLPARRGGRAPAVEVMIKSPYVAELIRSGQIHGIKDVMSKGSREGMQTFDQSLYALFKENRIELETALEYADSRADLEWQINFGGGASALSRSDSLDDLILPSQQQTDGQHS